MVILIDYCHFTVKLELRIRSFKNIGAVKWVARQEYQECMKHSLNLNILLSSHVSFVPIIYSTLRTDAIVYQLILRLLGFQITHLIVRPDTHQVHHTISYLNLHLEPLKHFCGHQINYHVACP